MKQQNQEHWEAERFGEVALGLEALPEPLERIIAQVFQLYQSRTPEELVTFVRQRYREDAAFIDPTLLSRPRRELALQFYSLQHLFSSVDVSGISKPEVMAAPQPSGPSLLKVTVHSQQRYCYSRTQHITQQMLPECTLMETTTQLLLDPRTGLVVRHEDTWDNHPSIRLPMAWRRFNSICTMAVYRLLGWGRQVADAEAKCAASSDTAKQWGNGG